jgi:hypothetical protein
MNHRPYPSVGRARRQLDRHGRAWPATPHLPLSALTTPVSPETARFRAARLAWATELTGIARIACAAGKATALAEFAYPSEAAAARAAAAEHEQYLDDAHARGISAKVAEQILAKAQTDQVRALCGEPHATARQWLQAVQPDIAPMRYPDIGWALR